MSSSPLAGAQIRKIDLPRLTTGVLHTKFWIVDQAHVYLGSANMDWRALTQVSSLSRRAWARGMPSCVGVWGGHAGFLSGH